MAKGIVSNVSRNPIELPDGRMIGPGETFSDFDESLLKDNLFVDGGQLAVGKDAKALQAQLDKGGEEVSTLQKQLAEVQDQLQKETLRANEAQAKADAYDPAQVEGLQKQLADQTARADKAEQALADSKKK